jgi:hypothetical protein
MATCKSCGEEADELFAVKVSGKTKKVCEDCKSRMEEDAEIGAEAQRAVRGTMEYKGR